MEHPFFPTTTTRAESLRWLTISEKLLAARDLMGSKSFATRARDADPSLTPADQILAIVDTLLAGDKRIGNNRQDLYAILRLNPQQGQDSEVMATKYRSLALILNPQTNKFPFAEQALRLVVEAWSLLSHPSSKSAYDKEVIFGFYAQQQPDPFHNPATTMPQNFMVFGSSGGTSGVAQSIHAGGSSNVGVKNFPPTQQVHSHPQVDPLAVGSNREQQNFMSFGSSSNVSVGSGSKPNQEEAFKSYTGIPDNVTFTSGPSYEQDTNKQKHPMQDFSNLNDKTENADNSGAHLENDEMGEETEESVQEEDDNLTFWTACPYCYNMFEYFRVYFDCTLRCQNCRRAFQAVAIPAPPPLTDGQENYFCCWGFLPLGVSTENWEKNRSAIATWTPFSPMFNFPSAMNRKENGQKRTEPRVYVKDDEVFIEISESSGSDEDWRNNDNKGIKKKVKNAKRKKVGVTPGRSAKNVQVDKDKNMKDVSKLVAPREVVDMPGKTTNDSIKKGLTTSVRKQPDRVAKNFEKLDLNVECSNETEDSAARVTHKNGLSGGEDDNIEGIGFFEGLDEFLSSLPILSVVGDDKIIKAA